MFEYGFKRDQATLIESIAVEFSSSGWDYTNECPRRDSTQFQQIVRDLEGATIHVAWYGTGNYEGKAFVLYEKDGKLYENHGSHCSCYGLEDQWGPEETSWEALKMRLAEGDYSLPDARDYTQSREGEALAALEAAIKAHDLTIN